ncbi:Pre-mRNA-splicing factor SPF27-like protein [Lachnellula cervina]|uniref:Pre-mRNA-splicing factor SPF27-like protein n=1 Tax=Lachnellula cervina TaxID=1316786 RepID=A0A7D8USX5_9HELO|nr:Pre-mRNA-splicing factor SPF27-like protein [Lachnellula cervina]
MSSETPIHDSLPYIDTQPTPSQRTAAQSLIDAETELPTGPQPQHHASLPPLPPQHFSPVLEKEMLRVAAQDPLDAIDRTRYESLSPPSPSPSPSSSTSSSSTTRKWQQTLAQAYTAQTYLSARSTNLGLLNEFGKNSWLVGNAQLEDILRGLEREVEGVKAEIDAVVVERRGAQEGVRGEVQGLEEGWRKGVGRVLEVEVAAEGVRREILERRREGAR